MANFWDFVPIVSQFRSGVRIGEQEARDEKLLRDQKEIELKNLQRQQELSGKSLEDLLGKSESDKRTMLARNAALGDIFGEQQKPIQGALTEPMQKAFDVRKEQIPQEVMSSIPADQLKKAEELSLAQSNIDLKKQQEQNLSLQTKPLKEILPGFSDEKLQSIFGEGITGDTPYKNAIAIAGLRKKLTPEDIEAMRIRAEERAEKRRIMAEERKNAMIPPDKAGLYTLSNESIEGIEDIRDMLFPKGTPESFDRENAIKGSLRFMGGAPLSREGQNLFRKMSSALAARQLIQTGVAARADETQSLYKQFMAGALSDPQAAYDALDQLQNFYQNYNQTLKTKGLSGIGAGEGGYSNKQNPTISTVSVLTATNPTTRERIQSTDGGKTWQPIK